MRKSQQNSEHKSLWPFKYPPLFMHHIQIQEHSAMLQSESGWNVKTTVSREW